MKLNSMSRYLTVIVLLGVFMIGYLAGSLNHRHADAQAGLGGVLDKASKMGGPVGAAAQLGSSLVEMQDHVNGLQKNIDSLKKVQSSLTGN